MVGMKAIHSSDVTSAVVRNPGQDVWNPYIMRRAETGGQNDKRAYILQMGLMHEQVRGEPEPTVFPFM